MKKTLPFTFLALLTLSFQTFAAPSFEIEAQSVLDRFNMKLGNDEQTTINGKLESSGQACKVNVYNTSKISPTFPDTTKSTQRLQVSVEANGNLVDFKLSRVSEVIEYSNRITTGASILNVSANNKTGIGNGRMKQSLEIRKTVGPHRSMTVSVTGFGGETLTCVTN